MVGLIHEYRGGVLENIHPGRICIVGDSGKLVCSIGDAYAPTYFRSTSKPLQALPVIIHGLDSKYELSGKELAIIASSHSGEPTHLKVILGLLEKTGFSEDDLIMLPVGNPPRKALHNCSGKHIGAMMLEKFLTGDHKGYWKPDSAAQKEITSMISYMTSLPAENIAIGVDGCGVPVFAVPQVNIAMAYLLLACPDMIGNAETREAARMIVYHMNDNPLMIGGTGSLCCLLNGDKNIVAKSGAQGVYALGLKKERLGISIKNEDGDEKSMPITVAEILRQLDYDNADTIAGLEGLAPSTVFNDNGIPVGSKTAVFSLSRPV